MTPLVLTVLDHALARRFAVASATFAVVAAGIGATTALAESPITTTTASSVVDGPTAMSAASRERSAAAQSASMTAFAAEYEAHQKALAKQKAKAKAVAEQRARAKAAAVRQAAAERAARNAVRNPQAFAQAYMSTTYGWGGDQFSCLNSLWVKESNWNYRADNPSSSAYGIPQALPGSKMSSFGADWATNPATQIKWGLDYISDVYGTPCSAWGKSQSSGWY